MKRRVFLTGTFDVENYGDLLFPLIARQRLAALGVDVLPVSPTTTTTRFADAIAPIAVPDMFDPEVQAEGVVIGGGYIIHSQSGDFLDAYREAGLGRHAYPSLWIGATIAAAIRDIPAMWNAPGAVVPFPRSRRETTVASVLRAADYVSVRDPGSLVFLDPPRDVTAVVTPDTAAGLAELWSAKELDSAFYALIERKGGDPDNAFWSIHLRLRSLGDMAIEELAAAIDRVARSMALRPLLVAIGPSLGDGDAARHLAERLDTSPIVLDDPQTLIEMTAAIRGSRLYTGASFHGYVAAAAFGVPAIVVARPAHRKFDGFVTQIGRPQDMARSWTDALAMAEARPPERDGTMIPPAVTEAVRLHWERIADCLDHPERRREERARLLRTVVGSGVRVGGIDWALATL